MGGCSNTSSAEKKWKKNMAACKRAKYPMAGRPGNTPGLASCRQCNRQDTGTRGWGMLLLGPALCDCRLPPPPCSHLHTHEARLPLRVCTGAITINFNCKIVRAKQKPLTLQTTKVTFFSSPRHGNFKCKMLNACAR